MKIPDASANVGAYYGNEENGQWQPNGVIIDSGVGGGVVGSGDAGIHRPPLYPVHIPRSHIPGCGDAEAPVQPAYPVHPPRYAPGYVMAGAYYPPAPYAPVPPAPQDDFADYMWMENEEEFDKQVMQQLEEEALMEQCIEAMLEDEQRERHRPVNGHNQQYPTTSNGNASLSLEETVSRSTLNPLAAEFVPTRARPNASAANITTSNAHNASNANIASNASTTPAEEKRDTPEESKQEEKIEEPADQTVDQTDGTQEKVEEIKTETTQPQEPPEVSAADIQTDKMDKRPKEKKDSKPKVETKKPIKQELKPKPKPQTVKSDTKVTPKKKEVKIVKSEVKVSESIEETDVKPQPAPVEEVTTPGIKPINYAAAAKANKPKKPTTPPAIEKPSPPPKIEKKVEVQKIEKKDKIKTEKPVKTEKAAVQRKNSMK